MGMAHMGDQLLIADAGVLQDALANLHLMGNVVPPAQIEADQIEFDSRIATAQEHAGDKERAVDALGSVMLGAAPGTRINAVGRGDVGARHADLAFEFAVTDHQVGKVLLGHGPVPVGKKSGENIIIPARVSTSDRPAHRTTLWYQRCPSPARRVSPEFQKVTGLASVPGVAAGWIRG